MNEYSRELKVGAAIVLAAVAAFAGVRFFQDLPLFGGSYPMYAEFEEAGGLVGGNPVHMKGVNVGTVDYVELNQKTQTVEVRFSVNEGIQIPEGSSVKVSGFSGLGGVRLSILPGPEGNPPLSAGATLQGPPEGTVFDRITDQAPALANKADSVLTNTNATMAALSTQLRNPESDLRRSLSSLKNLTGDLESVTTEEKETIQALLRNLRSVSKDLDVFMGENQDSLDLAVQRLNRSLDRLNRSLASFERTSATLDTITTKLNRGQGTAGRLLNDPGLYTKLDSAAAGANTLLRDFQQNPARYLEDLTLVKVF
jgi:phospholipid/cholesterol/gamma-HCH transport system substrate-binding protein